MQFFLERYRSCNNFFLKIIEKNLTKVLIFKEGIIENSLYNTAIKFRN